MKITLKEIRRLIKEELMAVNARSGKVIPIMGTAVPKPAMDKAKQITFDFKDVGKLKLDNTLGDTLTKADIAQIIFDFDKDDEFERMLSELEPSAQPTEQEPAAAPRQRASAIPDLPRIPTRLPVQAPPAGRRR